MEAQARSTHPWLQRWGRLLLRRVLPTALALVALYALLGYLVLPPIVRQKAAAAISEATGGRCAIQAVRLDPFALSATLNGVELADAAGGPIFAVRELFVALEKAALLKRQWVVSQLRLEAPALHVTRQADGATNLDALTAHSASAHDGKKPAARLPALTLRRIELAEGRIAFADGMAAEGPVRFNLAPLRLTLSELSTRPGSLGPFRLEAALDDQGALRAEGALGIDPPALRGRLLLSGVALDKIGKLLAETLPVALLGGSLKLEAGFQAELAGKTPALTADGVSIELSDLSVAPRGSRDAALHVTQLHVSDASLATLDPLASQGKFAIRGADVSKAGTLLPGVLPLEPVAGTLALEGAYRVNLSEAGQTLAADGLRLTLADLALAEPGAGVPLFSVAEVNLDQARLDLPAKQLQVENLAVRAARLACRVEPSGRLALREIFAAAPQPAPSSGSGAPTSTENPAPAWRVQVANASLQESALTYEDQRAASPVRVALEPLTLRIGGFDSGAAQGPAFELATGVNQTGTLRAAGHLSLKPLGLQTTLQAGELDLLPMAAYLRESLAFDIAGGRLGLQGTLACTQIEGAAAPAIAWQGDLSLKRFSALERHPAEPFLEWEALSLGGVEFTLPERRLKIAAVALDRPFARLVIRPDGTTAWGAYLQESSTGGAAPASTQSSAMPFEIGTIHIADGSGFFADLSLTPNFAANLRSLEGTIAGFSSAAKKPAAVKIQGQVGGRAPARITGWVNPWQPQLAADIALSFRNYDLMALTPYSSKFAGYAIRGGKLALDLHYTLSGGQLAGENRIMLDQLTLGERVESPSAVDLPVALAVALLKDPQGRIDIDLPVRGDMRAPDFSTGRLVGRALKTLLTRVVSAPFRFLAGLAGDAAEELDRVRFAYGQAELDETQRESLGKLAKALAQRQELRLEITGSSDEVNDRAALADRILMQQLQQRARGDAAGLADAASPPQKALSPEALLRLTIEAYQERFGKHPLALFGMEAPADPNALPKEVDSSLLLAAARRHLLDAIPVSSEQLERLALARAEAIRDELAQRGGVAAERLFLAQVKRLPPGEGASGVNAHLGLLP